MKMRNFLQLFMIVAVVAIVFGYASSSYGQAISVTNDMAPANPPQAPTNCGASCNATKGYKIGGNLVLAMPHSNLALGAASINLHTTGIQNTAIGGNTLTLNTTGDSNTALGVSALTDNNVGDGNTALGVSALSSNEQGSFNIGIGFQAGINADPGGNYNIHIGNLGVFPDSGVIRIGTVGTQTTSYVAGIAGVTLPIANEPLVCIDPTSGQLGTLNCATNGVPSAQQDIISQKQQVQIETLQRQNEELQQRISRLESLIAKK